MARTKKQAKSMGIIIRGVAKAMAKGKEKGSRAICLKIRDEAAPTNTQNTFPTP